MIKKILLLSFVIIGISQIQLKAQKVFDYAIDGQIFLKIKETETLDLPDFDIQRDGIEQLRDFPLFNELFSEYKVVKFERPFKRIKTRTFLNTYKIYFEKTADIDKFIEALCRFDIVEYAEKVPLQKSFLQPNDPYANNDDMWFLEQVEAYEAWDLVSNTSNKVTVAIVDDAVFTTHEDFSTPTATNIWTNQAEANGTTGVDDDENGYIDDINGWDAADEDPNPNPPLYADINIFSHGTHCAGTVGAFTNNGRGIASIAFNQAQIMAVKGKKTSILTLKPSLLYGKA